MSKKVVSLEAFREVDLELLSIWLEQPHVRPWYPDPNDAIETARSLCAQLAEGGLDAGHYMIAVNELRIGYIRWQLVPRVILDEIGLIDVPENSADVDLLIGERKHICRGIGAAVLTAIENKLSARGDVPAVGLTTNKENYYAHRAFEKSGYAVAAEYSPGEFGDCYLYMKELKL